jgi:hypothetical protein
MWKASSSINGGEQRVEHEGCPAGENGASGPQKVAQVGRTLQAPDCK